MAKYLLGNGFLPMGASASWADVAVPSGFNTTPPFTIQRGGAGGLFRVDPTFSLQTRAGIAVAKTYYVDSVNGNDANSGLTAELALKTLTAVNTLGDADRIYIASGSYFYKNQRPTSFNRNIEIIGVGATKPQITSDISNQLTSWAADGNHYKREPLPDFVANVFDETNLDSFGHPIRLTPVASAALVNSTPNSVYVNYPTGIYVRTFDSRAPDANLRFYDSVTYSLTRDSTTQYFENVFFNAAIFRNNSAAGGTKIYLKDCQFISLTLSGLTEIISQDCVVHSSIGDGWNYDTRNTIVTIGYEIDCEAFDLGLDSSAQGSTTHNGCVAVRVNGTYHHTYGQCIADTGTGQTWMLGTEMYNSSPAGVGYYAGVDTWLDHVNIHDCASYGIQIISGKTVRHKDITNTSGLDNLGAYTAY